MNISDLRCQKCGQNCFEASDRGAYLSRVNPKGETPMLVECKPSCETTDGDQNDALIRAIKGEMK